MRRLLFLLVILSLAACSNGQDTPPPSTPAPTTATAVLPTSTVMPATSSPTEIPATTAAPATQPPPSATTFPDPSAYDWQMVVSGLERPDNLQADGSGRLFVIEKAGRIRIIQDGQLLSQPFLDITDRVGSSGNEQGLLGLAFHPQYSQNGQFFVNYTDQNGDTVIARFQVSGDPNVADPGSEVKLLGVDQPYANHNGGVLAFGPDGYLYAGLGDGGSQGDPHGNAQNTKSLLGKILRIDVNSGNPYSVPPDNPFGNEVWAYGLRNPWRLSFDKATGDLYIGDVGQDMWEEIDYLPAGSAGGTNFGWNQREGAHDYKGSASPDFTEPVAEYSHPEGGCSVTGGYVYRGAMPEWNGIYIYGDYCTGMIWGLIHNGGNWQKQQLFDVDYTITSFGQDQSGEIYLVSDGGGVYKLVKK
jgi:glucose/arabinose dehydrogenase